MALTVGVNSHVTLVEAKAYASAREGNDQWLALSDEDLEQTLVSATDWLDTLIWAGSVDDEDQALAWPRTASIWDPKYGKVIDIDNSTPDSIKNAQVEMAIDIGNNGGFTESGSGSSGTPDSVSVGSISLSGLGSQTSSTSGGYVVGRLEVPPMVMNMISYLLAANNLNTLGGIGRPVWRAW